MKNFLHGIHTLIHMLKHMIFRTKKGGSSRLSTFLDSLEFLYESSLN